MSDLPRPRAYIDWVVPKDKNGNDIGFCEDTDTYNYYLDWLADYLYFTDIPVPENQLDTLLEFENDNGISSAVFWTSDDWGLSIWYTEGIEDSFIDGVTFVDFHAHELNCWNNFDDEDRNSYENPDDEYFTSEIEYNRIGREKVESLKVPPHIQHADIPYRPIFAKLLKNVHDKKERIKHLNYFYFNLDECASK